MLDKCLSKIQQQRSHIKVGLHLNVFFWPLGIHFYSLLCGSEWTFINFSILTALFFSPFSRLTYSTINPTYSFLWVQNKPELATEFASEFALLHSARSSAAMPCSTTCLESVMPCSTPFLESVMPCTSSTGFLESVMPCSTGFLESVMPCSTGFLESGPEEIPRKRAHSTSALPSVPS